MTARHKQVLALCLLVGLALRLVAVLALPPEEDYPDTEQFVLIGQSLLAGQGFAIHGGVGHGRGPIYPLLLAACFAVKDGTTLVKLAQVALDLATLLLVVVLARRLGVSAWGAVLAGALWAVNPYAAQFVRLVLSECLSGTVTLGALVVWAGLFDAPRQRAAALAGALFGLAALTRASTLGLVAIAAGVLAARGAAPLRERLRACAILCGAMALTLAPWVARNYRAHGELVLVAPIGGMTLYDSLNPYSDGGVRTRDHDVWPSGATLPEIDRKHRDLALAWARANPWRVAELAVEKQKRFWSPVPNVPRYHRWPFFLLGVYELPLLVAGVLGAVVAVLRRRPAGRLTPMFFYFPLLHTIYLGSLRYRMPIEPLLGLFAGVLLDSIRRPVIDSHPAS